MIFRRAGLPHVADAHQKKMKTMKIIARKYPILPGDKWFEFQFNYCCCSLWPRCGISKWRKDGFTLTIFNIKIIGYRKKPKWCNAPF